MLEAVSLWEPGWAAQTGSLHTRTTRSGWRWAASSPTGWRSLAGRAALLAVDLDLAATVAAVRAQTDCSQRAATRARRRRRGQRRGRAAVALQERGRHLRRRRSA